MSNCDLVTVVTGVNGSSLTIADTRWAIEGDPDAVWVWTGQETDPPGGVMPPANGERTPTWTVFTRICNSEHDPQHSVQSVAGKPVQAKIPTAISRNGGQK